MTRVENLFINDRGCIILGRGGNFIKFIDRGSHRGTSQRGTWTGCFLGIKSTVFLAVLATILILKKFSILSWDKNR